MKYCKDCKFFDGQTCMKSGDPVTGDNLSAREARNDENQCGPRAVWFEPAKEDWREPRDKDGYRTE